MDSNKYILITISIMVIALLVGAVFTPIVSSSTTRTITTEVENEEPDWIRFGYATTDPYSFEVAIDNENGTATVGGQTGELYDMLVLATENVAVAIVGESVIVSDGETNTNLGTSASIVRNASGLTINGESYTPGAWSYYPKVNGTYGHFAHGDLNTDDKPWVAWGNFAGVFTYNDRDNPDVGLVMDATVTDGVIEGVNWAKPSEDVGDLEPIEDITITPLDPSIITPIDIDPEPDASIQSADPTNGTRIGDLYYTFRGTEATVIGYASTIDWSTFTTIPDTVTDGGITYNVTVIGPNAFNGRTSLALTSLPSGVTSIENNAFNGCTSLALTSLPSGVTSIQSSSFRGCTSLALTSLPSGVTSIYSNAFTNCTNLALTSLPSGVTNVSSSAFGGCTSLALTSLPSGVTNIGTYAFQNCYALKSIVIYGNPTINDDAFAGCSLGSLVIVDSPTFQTNSLRMAGISEVLNLGSSEITTTTGGMSASEVRTDIEAIGYIAPVSVIESEQITIESPTTDILMILPLLAGVGVLMIGVGVYISRRY